MSNHSPFGDALDTNPTNAHRVTAFDTTRTGPPRKPQPHPSRAPSLLRRWRASGQMILLIVIVAQILDQGLSTVIVPIAPSIAAEYNMSSIATGLLFAAKPMGNIVVQPFVGPICDRLGRNVPMAFGFVLLISSSLLFGLASSLPLYYIARVVQGFGTAFSATAGMALLADCYMDDQQRGEAISLAMAGSGIGVLAGPPFGGVTFQYGGLKLPFLIIAGICLVDGLLLVLFLGSPQERAQKAREFERARQLKERATKNRSLPAIDQEVDGPDYDDDDDDDETNENETSASQQQQSSDSDAYMHAPSAVVEGAPKPTGITTLLRDPNVLACVCVIGAADSMPSVLEPLLPGYLTSVFAASPLETGLIQFFGFAEQLLEPNRVVGIIELGSDSVNMSIQSIFVADNGTVILGNAANVGSSSCDWANQPYVHTQAVAVGEGGIVAVVLPDNSDDDKPVVNVHVFKFVLGDLITAPVRMQTTNIYNAAFAPLSIFSSVKYVRDSLFAMGFVSKIFNTTTSRPVSGVVVQAFRINVDGGVVAGPPEALLDSICHDGGEADIFAPFPIVEVADAANMTLLVSGAILVCPTVLALARVADGLSISVLASTPFPPFEVGPIRYPLKDPLSPPGIAIVNQTHALARVRVLRTNSTVEVGNCEYGFAAMAAWVLVRTDLEAHSFDVGAEPLFWSPLTPACAFGSQNNLEPILQPVLKASQHVGDTVRLFSMETISNASLNGTHLFTFVPTIIDYNPLNGRARFAKADRVYLGVPPDTKRNKTTSNTSSSAFYNLGQAVVALNETAVLYGIQLVSDSGLTFTATLQVMRHVPELD